jgi:drug/metabolite transporter (DMT)-like permease
MDGTNRRSAASFFRAVSGKGLIAISLWGASFVFTRIALGSFNPYGLVAVRTVTGALLLVALLKILGGPVLPERKDRPVCIILGFVLGLHLWLQAYGLQYTSAINTGWIIGFFPVSIAVGAHLLNLQRMRGVGWLGVVVGAGGIALVTAASPPNFKDARFGDLLQVISCLTWTVYTLAGIRAVKRSGALRVTACAMGTAAVVMTITTVGTGLLHEALNASALLAVAFLGILCSGVAYFLWYQAVTEQGPTRTGSLLYFEPFVTLAVAAAVLHEPITVNAIAGGLIVLFGVWLVGRGSRNC